MRLSQRRPSRWASWSTKDLAGSLFALPPYINDRFASVYDNSEIELPAGSLSYYDGGGNYEHSLLLLHGLNGHSGTWRNNIPILLKENHVLAPSLPPWHGSPRDLDIGNYVKYLEEFLSALKLSKTAICGNSMGGWIGMRIAADHRELVEALVLEDSAGAHKTNESGLLQKINDSGLPVLIIWGKNDKVISVDAAKYLNSKIKQSSLVIFDDTGHTPHWEKSDEYNAFLLDFLRKVRGTRSRSDR